ncbi:MAG TPA: SAM-dependent methyltransferase [Candidatus Corynebacterium avicola]|uniref:site-specific DNA-methyltransferase (adenine-specific) n=1 Tax=Candidatus Corynebacterium avicola TaxID=2838527 RepID=A0A9D1RRN5_9CORY|nr:SAM-dependent methyltransferase [Candidatus Corynebacterium avicola]
MKLREAERLVKSRQRVADHGEVFTPSWLVEDMLHLVQEESERIDSRVLEPACGSGNFLVPVLTRKLLTVAAKYGKSDFEKRHYALFSLMCIYGIELLPDNAAECRDNLATLFNAFLGVDKNDDWARAARTVLTVNIIQGDALTMSTSKGDPIAFAEWGYLGKGKFHRRDFRYDKLTKRSDFDIEGSLFADMDEDVFGPQATYPTMTVRDLVGQVDPA